MKRFLLTVASFVLLAALVAGISGCGGASSTFSSSTAMPTAATASDRVGSSGNQVASEPPPAEGMEAPSSTSGDAPSAAGGSSGANLNYGAPDGTGSASSGTLAPPDYQSPLTAGQVDDNAKFADYLQYLQSPGQVNAIPIAVEKRVFVRVVDGAQKPVAGARVQLYDGQQLVFDGRTVSDGRVLFFPDAAGAEQAQQLRAVVSRGQQKVEATLRADAPEQTVSLNVPDNTGPVNLDIVFLMDATGSMDDEIATLKATVDSIANRIEQLPGSSRPRLALVAYRDRGDEFVTRAWDFTSSMQQFSDNLSGLEASGGGDYPESVNAGLHDAIHLQGWSDSSSGRHLRLIVLVGDAPPHLDYPNDYRYPKLLQEAVAAGIKVFPIGASGLNDQGEYIFRQFAQVTQGQFIFLTYANGESGAPGPATDHHVTDFTVRNLDGLVVNLVAAEVANQVGPQSQQDRGVQVAAVPVQASVAAPPSDDLLAAFLGWSESVLGQIASAIMLFVAGVLVTALLWSRRSAARVRKDALLPTSMVLELGEPGPKDEFEPLTARVEEGHLSMGTRARGGEQPTVHLPALPYSRVRGG